MLRLEWARRPETKMRLYYYEGESYLLPESSSNCPIIKDAVVHKIHCPTINCSILLEV